jgi:Restriction endonuclease AspBHI N-terminal/Restriction endonuclease
LNTSSFDLEMNTVRTFEFAELTTADLIVDAVYKGGTKGHSGDDPIQQLLGVGIGGGFRYLGSQSSKKGIRFCALYSSLADPDWPDALYPETGRFIYFGDNRKPGHNLDETKRKGNRLLAQVFSDLHLNKREQIPPFFVFSKVGAGRDIAFRGLAVPGAHNVPETEDLAAIWRTSEGRRFQNYRAIFTILDVPKVTRSWLDGISSGNCDSAQAPDAWLEWTESGRYRPLEAPRTIAFRSKAQQLPGDPQKLVLLNHLVSFFKNHPKREYAFERCAGDLVRLMDTNISRIDLTRPWKDGGRDALGEYSIGTVGNAIVVEFALEAKCKTPSVKNSSTVKDTARLIARLRYRQFGIFITTSCLHDQAYREILDDAHPVLILSGVDIVEILAKAGITSIAGLQTWLGTFSGSD